MEDTSKTTSEYLAKVINAVNTPSTTSTVGMQTPACGDHVSLYSQVGSKTINVTNAGGVITDNILVYYDPEASLRSGQNHAVIVQRTGNTINSVETVTVGRISDDFISAGVLSSSLEIRNTSGRDLVAGTQVHAVVYNLPPSLSNLTQSELHQIINDKDTDIVQVDSKDDGGRTTAITQHLGFDMGSGQSDVLDKLSKRVYAVNVSSSTTFGENFSARPEFPDQTFAAGSTTYFYNSSLISSTAQKLGRNPFTFSTYSVSISLDISKVCDAATAEGDVHFVFEALDASGTIISTKNIKDYAHTNTTAEHANHILVSFLNLAKPIANLKIGYSAVTVAVTMKSADLHIESWEEASGNAIRPVHVVKIDGINSGASITVAAASIITGVPDSTNAFIANKLSIHTKLDREYVQRALFALAGTMLKATSIQGHSFISKAVENSSEEISSRVISDLNSGELQARGWGSVVHAIRNVGKVVKDVRDVASEVAKYAKPALQLYSITGMKGSDQADKAARAIDTSQKVGLLKSMSGMRYSEY